MGFPACLWTNGFATLYAITSHLGGSENGGDTNGYVNLMGHMIIIYNNHQKWYYNIFLIINHPCDFGVRHFEPKPFIWYVHLPTSQTTSHHLAPRNCGLGTAIFSDSFQEGRFCLSKKSHGSSMKNTWTRTSIGSMYGIYANIKEVYWW